MSDNIKYECVDARIGDGYDIVKVHYFGHGIRDGVEYVYDNIQDVAVANALCHLLNKVEMLTRKIEVNGGSHS